MGVLINYWLPLNHRWKISVSQIIASQTLYQTSVNNLFLLDKIKTFFSKHFICMSVHLALQLSPVTHPFLKPICACLAPLLSPVTIRLALQKLRRHAVYNPWFSWRQSRCSILASEATGSSWGLLTSWTSSHVMKWLTRNYVLWDYIFCFLTCLYVAEKRWLNCY